MPYTPQKKAKVRTNTTAQSLKDWYDKLLAKQKVAEYDKQEAEKDKNFKNKYKRDKRYEEQK